MERYCIITALINKRIYPSLESRSEMVFISETNGKRHWVDKLYDAKRFESEEEATGYFNVNKAELLKYYNTGIFNAEIISISVLEIEDKNINYREDINI